MPKIDDYFARYRELSGSASEIARQLNFAAIAIVWIFKMDKPDGMRLPQELLLPTAFVILSLVLDLLQYFVGSLLWRFWGYHLESLEKKAKAAGHPYSQDHDFRSPRWMPRVLELFYYSKLAALVVAYALLGAFLWSHLT